MFSGCLKPPIWNEMESLARRMFIRMFAPTVIVGIWTYAHLEGLRSRQWVSMWKEGGNVRIGNPYTAPVPPRMKHAPAVVDEPGDIEIEGVATAEGDF